MFLQPMQWMCLWRGAHANCHACLLHFPTKSSMQLILALTDSALKSNREWELWGSKEQPWEGPEQQGRAIASSPVLQRKDETPQLPCGCWAIILKCQPFQMPQKGPLQVIPLCPHCVSSYLTDPLIRGWSLMLVLHPSVVPSSQIHKPRYWPFIPKHPIFM